MDEEGSGAEAVEVTRRQRKTRMAKRINPTCCKEKKIEWNSMKNAFEETRPS